MIQLFHYLEVLLVNLQIFFNGSSPQILQHVHNKGQRVTFDLALGADTPHIQPAVAERFVDQIS